METYYTIIKIAHNPIAGDNLSIGLLLFDGRHYWVRFSEARKSLAKQLLTPKGDTVEFVTKQVLQKVEDLNKAITSENGRLFETSQLLNAERFLHLSDYANGVVRFTEPKFINDNINEEKFEKLYRLLIDKTPAPAKFCLEDKEAILKATVEQKLIRRVEQKVHTNIELTPDNLSGLYFNINVDCIGLNGAFIGAKAISFNRKFEAIDKEISHYFGLISTLNLKFKSRKGDDKFYIIGDEPSDIKSKEHRTWENIRKNPVVKLLHPEESELIAEEIERKQAKEFLDI